MVSRFFGMFKGKNISDDDPCEEPECLEIRDMSSDFIDRDMDEKSQLSMTRHLDKCPPCNAFVRTLRRTVDMLRGSPDRKAPSDFRQRLRAKLRNEGH